MGVGQREHGPFLLLDGRNRVGTGNPARRWPVLDGELDQGRGELGRVATLPAVPIPCHAATAWRVRSHRSI